MQDQFSGVYQGKRVLVTGHTGFKGGWLSLWLSQLGAKVYGYALAPPTEPNLFESADVASVLVANEMGDVCDKSHLQMFVSDIQPDIIFHLAAQSLVRLSYKEPVQTYETNVMGTVNILEAVRHTNSVRVCQVVTSDKCYENREWVYAYRENEPMGGYDPYSNSKGCAELVVSSYRRSFFRPDRISEHGVSLSSVRAGNVIGGGDWALDRIIPDCVRALSVGEAIEVRNPDAIRPWQHVLEPLSGYLWLAAKQFQEPGQYEGGWNFGPSGAGNIKVQQIVEQVSREWGDGQWRMPEKNAAVHEANFLKLDISKASSLLSWRPVCSVSEAVTDTIKWYKLFHNGCSDMRQFSLEQIKSYTDRAKEINLAWVNEGD